MENLKIYLAGKMGYTGFDCNYPDNWRSIFLKDTCYNWGKVISGDELGNSYPVLENAIELRDIHGKPKINLDYTGPYFVDNAGGHGSYCEDGLAPHAGGYKFSDIPKLSREAIDKSDIVFGWISDPDSYGTIYELAYAKAKEKHLYVYYDKKIELTELWFVLASLNAKEIEPIGNLSAIEMAYSDFSRNFSWMPQNETLELGSNDHYLYIIKSGDSAYKIGISKNPQQRLKQLQTGNQNPLKLVIELHFESIERAREVEREIHRRVEPYNSSGEWFRCPPGVLSSTIFEYLENH